MTRFQISTVNPGDVSPKKFELKFQHEKCVKKPTIITANYATFKITWVRITSAYRFLESQGIFSTSKSHYIKNPHNTDI